MSRYALATIVAAFFAVSTAFAQYTVSASGGAYASIAADPAAVAITLADEQVSTQALPFAFPSFLGALNSVGLSSNGVLHLDGSTTPFLLVQNNTVANPARIGIAQEDLNPAAAGAVYRLDTANSVIFSFEGVPFFSNFGSVEAQAELFDNGDIEIRFGVNNPGGFNNIQCGPVGPGALGLTAQSIIPQFNALGVTTAAQLPQNTGVRFVFVPTALDFQPNSTNSSLLVDGQLEAQICPGEFAFINGTTALIGNPYEILVNYGERVSLSNGGSATLNLQTFNLNINSPFLALLNQSLNLGFFVPHPGNLTIGFFGADAFLGSGQQLVFDAASPDLFTLSAAIQVEASAGGAVNGTLAGDDASTIVAIGGNAFPTCANAPVPFAGTSFTQVGIDANGRLFFEGSGGDFSPTVFEALNRAMVGYWVDFNQTAGGAINYSSDAQNGFQVIWSGVPYFGDAQSLNNLSITVDPTGVITLDVFGIQPRSLAGFSNTAFFGLSSGTLLGGATDAGVTAFGLGSGANAQPTDMLYDFGSINPSASTGILPSVTALQAGTGVLTFIPGANPGEYSWTGL